MQWQQPRIDKIATKKCHLTFYHQCGTTGSLIRPGGFQHLFLPGKVSPAEMCAFAINTCTILLHGFSNRVSPPLVDFTLYHPDGMVPYYTGYIPSEPPLSMINTNLQTHVC